MDFPTLAPAPPDHKRGPPPQRMMGYSCQTCARRKVKCDKVLPACAACRKSGVDCIYEAPPPRGRKRVVNTDVLDKLARYERILKQNGLLGAGDADKSATSATPNAPSKDASKEPILLHWNATSGHDPGAVIENDGKARYVDSSFWRNMGVGDERLASDDEDDEGETDQVTKQMSAIGVSDPLTDVLVGTRQSLEQYHPTAEAAMIMWKAYSENVEPITKILHVPSMTKTMESIAREPHLATPKDICIAFAVYHFAIFSMSESECLDKLGQPRADLLSAYHFATRQALVNASFLRTTDLVVLQAFALFLLPSRYTYDAHTYWILTGAAFRIGQRIGLHRDGAKLKLAPFDTEMRRRLFYPLLSLDGMASQLSGTALPQLPSMWDTLQPLNINDDHIWPGMTEPPVEQKGATDMMFRLSRTCIGAAFARIDRTQSGDYTDTDQAEKAIQETEREVEEKYIRYCDVINPLHFLAIALARTGILAMRQRAYLAKMRNKTATDVDKQETLQLAFRILDTDNAVCTHSGTSRFRWHTQSFFLWGMWDSLTFVLNGLWKDTAIFSAGDVEAAWTKMAQIYEHHEEMLESKQTINIAFRKLTLAAWDAHRQRSGTEGVEPKFVASLRERQERRRQRRAAMQAASNTLGDSFDIDMMNWPSVASSSESPFDFNIEDADWTFWDGLLRGGAT